MRSWRLWADLVKIRICAAASLSSLAVFVLAAHGLDRRAALLGSGVFVLACGACALNEYQERDLDRLMRRTQHRPLPSGRLSPGQALTTAFVFLLIGFALVFKAAGLMGSVLAAAAVAWYIAVYTPLKRVTPFAVVPGALVGVVPPILGWLSAGRPWQDPRLVALCFFFYLWQVPHFWLLVPSQSADLGRAGFPHLAEVFGPIRLARLTAVWMSMVAASVLLLPLFGVVGSTTTCLLLFVASVWLTGQAVRLLRHAQAADSFRVAFVHLNAFVLVVLVLLGSAFWGQALSFE